MSNISVEERLKQEQTLKALIRDTIKSICDRGDEKYINICAFASRSDSDNATVVNNVFDLMTSENIQCTLMGAISQMESKLDGWGE